MPLIDSGAHAAAWNPVTGLVTIPASILQIVGVGAIEAYYGFKNAQMARRSRQPDFRDSDFVQPLLDPRTPLPTVADTRYSWAEPARGSPPVPPAVGSPVYNHHVKRGATRLPNGMFMDTPPERLGRTLLPMPRCTGDFPRR